MDAQGIMVCWQPEPGLQESSVQASWSSQSACGPAWHAPAEHVSFVVQALPSLHEVPAAPFGFERVPLAGWQVPATWHGSLAVQTTGFAPVQTPDAQVSVRVQALPSLHDVPSGALGFEQVPLAGLQVPATWHGSLAVQTTG